MKKTAGLFLIFVLIFAMVGCGNNVTINSQENDLIAEYIAGVVLKYNGDGLLQQQQIVIEQNKENETQSLGGLQTGTQGTTQSSSNSGTQSGIQSGEQSGVTGSVTGDVYKDIAAGLGISNAVVEYVGYDKGSKYPEDGLFSVPANSNCVVFGFEFNIKNTTQADIVANTDAAPIMFKLEMGGQTIAQSSSILVNDMTSLKNVTIKAGESYEAAVIFQVPVSVASETSGMKLQVFSNGAALGNIEVVSQ